MKKVPPNEYKPPPYLKAEEIAPARLEVGFCVRTCPRCGIDIRENQHGNRGTNFLSHYGGKRCRAAAAERGGGQ